MNTRGTNDLFSSKIVFFLKVGNIVSKLYCDSKCFYSKNKSIANMAATVCFEN